MTTHISPLGNDAPDAEFADFYSAYQSSFDHEYATLFAESEMRVLVSSTNSFERYEHVVARDDDGAAVGWGELNFALRDNTHFGFVDFGVVPDRRGRGHGAAILDHLLGRTKADGRRQAQAFARVPLLDDPAEIGPSCGSGLLASRGFKVGQHEAQRVLDLPLDSDKLSTLARRIEEHHAPYRLVTWSGPCPEEWVDRYAALRARMVEEAPSGELELEPEEFTAERVREQERELAEMGRTAYTAIAVSADGVVAGHSMLMVPTADRLNAFQWDTLVLPEHRGFRLGTALKLRTHLAAVPDLAGKSYLHTWNAVENAPMITVNERMGYRLVGYHAAVSVDF